MKERHAIAVRTLVAFVLRTGDLKTVFELPGRPVEGIRVHQRIQRQRPDGYQPEVSVAAEVETDDLILVVTGRIDGVLVLPEMTVVEEIKSTRHDLDLLVRSPDPCHWGQVLVYACLFAREKDLAVVTVQLTYCHLDSGEIRERKEVLSRDALEAFFSDLVARYLKWARRIADWRQLRDDAALGLSFPFTEYRNGQRDMAVAVYRAMRDGEQAIIQAATGIGKTMAALFPAVKALGEGHLQRIFFLTARTTGKDAAHTAFDHLQKAGMRLKRVFLTAKDKICFNPEAACDPEQCAFARGHYDRLPKAMLAAFTQDCMDRVVIEKAARKHRVCPFELSLDLALWADCLVCDYNYAFDPRVYLRRFFDEEAGRYGFLVDEAHNLVDRARDMFSAAIVKSQVLALRREVKDHLPDVYRAAGKVNAWMVRARRQTRDAGGFESANRLPDGLEPLLRHFLKAAEAWLARNEPDPFREILLEYYFNILGFLRIWELFDKGYVVCSKAGGDDFTLKLFCLDPSSKLCDALKRSHAVVFFSATMTPANYFQRLFGCRENARRMAIRSPFPAHHLGVLVAGNIPTTFNKRESSARMVAALIETFVCSRTGNYLCFFPSYAYMRMVIDRIDLNDGTVHVMVQEPDMDDAGRDAFLMRFSADNTQSLVGFAVMGGVFAEGIDLVGDRLCGAIVVGVGLPAVSIERNLIREYFDAVGDGQASGFDFAYRFPGINRVLQAAGRVIRSATDRGALLLVDQRFCAPDYARLLPDHWSLSVVRSEKTLQMVLSRFWDGGN